VPTSSLPVRVAAVNDYELVVQGTAALLSQFPEQLFVCERIVLGEPIDEGPVDVALYDTYGRVGVAADALRSLVEHPEVRRVAVFSLDLRPALVQEAREAGASGFVSKALPGPAIADALVRVAQGEAVFESASPTRQIDDALDWPGRADGLTERESQVLVLCAEGRTNPEIAEALYIGLETVKSHLRKSFKQLGLRNRIQAANYVHRSDGFRPYSSGAS